MRRALVLALGLAALSAAPAAAFEWPLLTGGGNGPPLHPAAKIKDCSRLETRLVVIEVDNGFGCWSPAAERKVNGRRMVVLRAMGDQLRINGMPIEGSALAWYWSNANDDDELMLKVDGVIGAPQQSPVPIVTVDMSGELNVNQAPSEVSLGSGLMSLRELGSEESATMFVGVDSKGKRFAKVDSSVGLAPFEPNAGYTMQSNDRDGEPRDFRIQASGMEYGALELSSFCLAYSQQAGLSCRGSDSTRFQDNDKACGVDEGTWSGAGTFTLPTPTEPEVSVWGGFNGNGMTYIGGARDFGYDAPLTESVYLDHIAAEVCRQPSWLLQGEADIRFGPANEGVWPFEEARFDGNFTFYPNSGIFQADGLLHALGVELGDAWFTYVPPASVTFGGSAQLSVGPPAARLRLEGGMDGFFDGQRQAAQLGGSVTICVIGGGIDVCRRGEAVVSTAGIGACFDFMTINLGFYTIRIQAGAGYAWGGTPRIMVGSCGLGAWRVARRSAALRQGGSGGFTVPAGEVGIGVRVRGTTAPPRVALLSPSGLRIIRTVEQGVVDGSHAVMFDGNDAIVMIADPQPGAWRVVPHDDSPPIAGLETADYDPPPAFRASVADRGTHELLTYRYAANPRHSVRLYEKGDGVHQDLGYPQGRRCAEGAAEELRETRVLCGRLRFTPEPGPAGTRRIMASVRDRETGTPIADLEIATFAAEAEPRLAAPRPVIVERNGAAVRIRWDAVPEAIAYELEVETSADEQRLLEVDGGETGTTLGGISRESTVVARVRAVSDSGKDGFSALGREPGAPFPRDCQVDLGGPDPTPPQLEQALRDCERQIDARRG